MKIKSILVENIIDPINIDTANPRFSWVFEDEKEPAYQKGYRIRISGNEGNFISNIYDVWDSGYIESNALLNDEYAGEKLINDHDYHCCLQIKTDKGEMVEKGFSFSTAYINGIEGSKWIGREKGQLLCDRFTPGVYADEVMNKNRDMISEVNRSILLRKEFKITKKIKRARVNVCGLGYYVLYLNGRKAGDKVLAPLRTKYQEICLYDTYDLAPMLEGGENVIGISLGNGWFSPNKKYWGWQKQFHGSPRAFLKLSIEFEDGGVMSLETDETWKISDGPVYFNSIYDGEHYDANLEKNGWDKPGFDDGDWRPAKIVETPCNSLRSNIYPPVKIMETIYPLKTVKSSENKIFVDFGQNFSGWIKLKVKGKKDTRLEIRYAECQKTGNEIDPTSNGRAEVKDIYILAGKEIEEYEPSFTYHGFRYAQINCFPNIPDILEPEGRVIHSAVRNTGELKTGNDLINRIQHCIFWSQRSNMISEPIDCPQRDERLGWLADAYVTEEEALLNFDSITFYKKWLKDIQNDQDVNGDIGIISPWQKISNNKGVPSWSCGYVFAVWYLFRHTGDKRILKEHYPNIKRYIEYLRSCADNNIQPRGKYGDWMSPIKGWIRGDPEMTNTSIYCLAVKYTGYMANELSNLQDHHEYSTLFEEIKQALNNRYFDSSKGIYDDGSQFCQAIALHLDIVPDAQKDKVISNLIDDIMISKKGHLSTGVLGTKFLFDALDKIGRNDIAYSICTKEGYPGWADMISGMTTLSESWSKAGGTYNHIMFGSVGAWFYRSIAGIRQECDSSGYDKILIAPYVPDGLMYVKASVETVKGRVGVSWCVGTEGLDIEVMLPVGSAARVEVPKKFLKAELIKVNNEEIYGDEGFFVNSKTFDNVKADGRISFKIHPGSNRIRILE